MPVNGQNKAKKVTEKRVGITSIMGGVCFFFRKFRLFFQNLEGNEQNVPNLQNWQNFPKFLFFFKISKEMSKICKNSVFDEIRKENRLLSPKNYKNPYYDMSIFVKNGHF